MTDEEQIEQESTPIPGHRPRGEAPEEPEAEKKAPAPKVDPEVAKLRADLKRESTRRKEAEDGMKFWSEKAAHAAERPAKAAKEADEDETPLSVDLVDAITSGNKKQIKAALKEMGVALRDEVDRDIDTKIGNTRAQIAHEAQLYSKYPDLQDESSALFERTKEIYQDLAKDPTMAKSPKLVEAAARIANAELGKPEKQKAKPAREADPDEDEPEYEEDRQERVRSQQGSRGRAAAEKPRDNDELSGMQKSIIEKFRAAGAPLTEDTYRARARKGVQMSGLPGRRA